MVEWLSSMHTEQGFRCFNPGLATTISEISKFLVIGITITIECIIFEYVISLILNSIYEYLYTYEN